MIILEHVGPHAGMVGAPQIVPARIVWRTELGQQLNAHNGQTLRQLCAGLDMARQSVSKHLAVLEAAGLVTTVRRGREKLHYLNTAPRCGVCRAGWS